MGYYITTDQTEPIIINPDQYDALIDALRFAEGGRTISYCQPVAEYLERYADADRRVGQRLALADLFGDFGFAVAPPADDADLATAPLVLEYWYGEKMPFSWTTVWDALGHVITTPATWIVRGEDGVVWAERVGHGKGHTAHKVALVVVD